MMKGYVLALFLLFNSSFTYSQNWQLVWEDNFEGNSLDLNKWVHDYGTGSQYNLSGWGNNELQYYQSQNTSLTNGIATIKVMEEPNGIIDSWGALSYFSSSKITTKGLFDFRFGKVEARIKTIDGEGFWPAFWMLPTGGSWNCDGEIDIMEQWGNNYLTNSTTGAAHIGTCPYSQSTHFYQNFSTYISSGSYADDFHVYSLVWQEDTITWLVDDTELFSINPSSYWSIPTQHNWPFNSNEWYLMLNLAIKQSGPNLNSIFPNQIEIDYVRVYQKNITSTQNTNNYYDSQIYPNPTSDYLFLEDRDLIQIKICNIEGRIILEKKLYQTNKVDISLLTSGLYLVELVDSFGIKRCEKLIIN